MKLRVVVTLLGMGGMSHTKRTVNQHWSHLSVSLVSFWCGKGPSFLVVGEGVKTKSWWVVNYVDRTKVQEERFKEARVIGSLNLHRI